MADFYKLLEAEKNFYAKGNTVAKTPDPVTKEFNIDPNVTLKKDDLLKGQYVDHIRDYIGIGVLNRLIETCRHDEPLAPGPVVWRQLTTEIRVADATFQVVSAFLLQRLHRFAIDIHQRVGETLVNDTAHTLADMLQRTRLFETRLVILAVIAVRLGPNPLCCALEQLERAHPLNHVGDNLDGC